MPPATYISFSDLQNRGSALATQSPGCASASCGSHAEPADLAPGVWDKIKDHPCYSESAHHHYARMHIAVAPACNIQCNYCNRKYDCSNESRPGVVSEKLTPEQAVRKVLVVAKRIPQLSVIGIAGPGDALANPDKTFATFRALREQAPGLKLCLSTNGLALVDHIDEICALGIDHVTITISALEPEIGARIYPWIFHEHRRIEGSAAAKILAERQLLGLEKLTERGVLAKINSVLIPGINDQHLAHLNREVKARGAFLHNIMPLISDPAHGTVFGLSGQRGPSAQELKAVQDECSGGAQLMRHCRLCRADAVGLLGEDRSEEFSLEALDAQAPGFDSAAHSASMHMLELESLAQQRARQSAEENLSESGLSLLVAVASRGQGRINQHFGHADEFQIFEVSAQGARFIGHRRVDLYCQGGWGEDEQLPSLINAINDCHAVLVAKIGACPRQELAEAGIEVNDRHVGEFIESAVLDWFADYAGRVSRGETEHRARGDAALRQGAFTAAA